MDREANRKILLVDDEAFIRLIGADALADAGYEVVEAASAEQALRILESGDDVVVLFTDIRMPGSMDGLQLADLVHARWPAVKILLTSGDTWPPKSRLPDNGRFIAKPYRMDALTSEIDSLIDE